MRLHVSHYSPWWPEEKSAGALLVIEHEGDLLSGVGIVMSNWIIFLGTKHKCFLDDGDEG